MHCRFISTKCNRNVDLQIHTVQKTVQNNIHSNGRPTMPRSNKHILSFILVCRIECEQRAPPIYKFAATLNYFHINLFIIIVSKTHSSCNVFFFCVCVLCLKRFELWLAELYPYYLCAYIQKAIDLSTIVVYALTTLNRRTYTCLFKALYGVPYLTLHTTRLAYPVIQGNEDLFYSGAKLHPLAVVMGYKNDP